MDKKTKPQKGRTITLKKKQTPNAEKWVKWLEENCQASAGPHPSLVGVRKQYWGNAALIVRAGAYLYLICNFDDGRRMPWEG